MRIFVFKPDGIGDFVLASGAIRLLAREYGEENLAICVRSVLVPLARAQFPTAKVFDLPTAAERKIINLFLWNFVVSIPLWFRLRWMRMDAAICLRSMRNYLETLLFFSVRAKRFVACENILLRGKQGVRAYVERTAALAFHPELVRYPEQPAEVPLEIESHRRLLSRLLSRDVEIAEVIPDLQAPGIREDNCWILAPITNLASKRYPFARWRDILVELREIVASKKIILAGAKEDRPLLQEMRDLLIEAGLSNTELVLPETLVDYVTLISRAGLIMTVDTAAAHLATALDKPALVLFSGLHTGMFGPWQRSDRQAWLLPDAGTKKKKWHAGIPPERAAEAIRRITVSSSKKAG